MSIINNNSKDKFEDRNNNLDVGVKYDDDKERFDLFPPYPMLELGKVFTFGSKKYEDRNWEKGMKWGKIFSAAMRHLWKFWLGEKCDEESGLHHLAHAAWNCLILLEYTITRQEFDDRYKRSIQIYKELKVQEKEMTLDESKEYLIKQSLSEK